GKTTLFSELPRAVLSWELWSWELGVVSAFYIIGFPSSPLGIGTPRSFRIVGDRSMMLGVGVAILRLTNSTPPLISVAVAQWSPLHLRLLSWMTASSIPPSVSCQPTR